MNDIETVNRAASVRPLVLKPKDGQMKVTSHRKPNGTHELRDESGAVVGRAWHWPNRTEGFGLQLHGVYWRGEASNTRAGCTTTPCLSLGHARDKASTVLDMVRES